MYRKISEIITSMIKITDFSKKYGKDIIYDNADAEFETGKISFLMGKNGCGKTTLIKCISDLEGYSGKIEFDGRTINDEVRKDIFVVWDECTFYKELSGLDNLICFAEGKSKAEIKEAALKYFSPELIRKKVSHYSYGQKKKLSLALISILRPKTIIMDEVTNGLDYAMLKGLKRDLQIWKNDSTIILTGHHLEFYSEIVDTVYVIGDKKMQRYEKKNGEKFDLGEIYDEYVEE